MKHFFQRLRSSVGQNAVVLNEEVGHLVLPLLVHYTLRHFSAGTGSKSCVSK